MSVLPHRSAATRPMKKLSHSQPARSRPGQSVKTSTAFCLKVSRAASKIRLSAGSDDWNVARSVSGFTYSRNPRSSSSQAPPATITLRYFSSYGSNDSR